MLCRLWWKVEGWFHPQRRGGSMVSRFLPAQEGKNGAGGGSRTPMSREALRIFIPSTAFAVPLQRSEAP